MVTMSKHGMPKDLDKLENMIAVFTVREMSFLIRGTRAEDN